MRNHLSSRVHRFDIRIGGVRRFGASLLISCLFMAAASTLGAADFENVPRANANSARTIDQLVADVWQQEGIVLDLRTAEADSFRLDLRYRASQRDHPLRAYVDGIPGAVLQSTTREHGAVLETYRLNHPSPDLDGPPESMPSFSGRLARDGYHRVIDAKGHSVLYSENDFESLPAIRQSSSLQRLVNDFGGDAEAFVRDLYVRSQLAGKLFAEYPGQAIASLQVLRKGGREMIATGDCPYPIGFCDDEPPLKSVMTLNLQLSLESEVAEDPLYDYLMKR